MLGSSCLVLAVYLLGNDDILTKGAMLGITLEFVYGCGNDALSSL